MKKLILIGFMAVMAINANARTVETNEEIVLNFDNNIDHLLDKSFNGYLKVIEHEVRFPSGSQEDKLYEAIELLDEIVNSEEFKRKVIGYIRPNGKREYAKNYLWNDSKVRLSNEQIYNIIMTGDERSLPNTIAEANLYIRSYKCKWWQRLGSCRKVIGYTNPSSSKWINVNWKFYSHYEVHEMVGNLMHEWIHLLGFLHGNQNLHEEVPYVVGRIASQIAREKLKR